MLNYFKYFTDGFPHLMNVIFLYSIDDMCRLLIVVSVWLIFSRLLRQMFNNK